ncbi:MAG: hypothetical protein ACE5HQ_12815 [Gemmatimonadota bacterium]
MGKQRLMGFGIAAILAVAAACSDGSTGPLNTNESLSGAEGDFLVQASDELMDGILGDQLSSMSADVSAPQGLSLSTSAADIVTTFTFERTRPCRNGGEVVLSGSGKRTFNPETKVMEMTVSGDKTITRCARTRRNVDVVITITGNGTFDAFRRKVNRKFDGIQTTNHAGEFSYFTSDGREGSCEFDLHAEADPETHTKTITGTFCGRDVNRTVQWDG